ncbi:MAG: type I restriction-modification system subunit M [Vulcanimicrobiaceae bacterium]
MKAKKVVRKASKQKPPAAKSNLRNPRNGKAPQSFRNGAKSNGGNVGFEAKLFKTADGLRGNVDAAEYKHIVLGLIFLKYISDMFEEHRAKLEATKGADPEDRDEYTADRVFWVPKSARWPAIQGKAKSPEIGTLLDDAMTAIEKENPRELRSVLPKEYANPKLDPSRLGKLIDVISSVGFSKDDGGKSKDVLGRVYEYFLKEFASAEGRKAGEFYTPRCIVQTLVEMIEPFKGRIYDPCCGSGGMFVQSEEFIIHHHGRVGNVAIYGQESNHTTWRLCKMNMAIRGTDADIRWNPQGSFVKDDHPDLKADFILANPPFNDDTWGGENLKDDKRWKYGVPPETNANFAWIQHFISHLSASGVAAFVMANGSMSSNQNSEGDIRRRLIEDNLVDCMIALPGQLFYGTQIPVCIWILARNRQNHKFRDRHKEILFIDARKLGTLVDRIHRELLPADVTQIANTYHAWRSKDAKYKNILGFCSSTAISEVRKHDFILTPGRYVGAEKLSEERDEALNARISKLAALLVKQQAESTRLNAQIIRSLKDLGFVE